MAATLNNVLGFGWTKRVNDPTRERALTPSEIESLGSSNSNRAAWELCRQEIATMMAAEYGGELRTPKSPEEAGKFNIGVLQGRNADSKTFENLGLVDDHGPSLIPRIYTRLLPYKGGHSPVLQGQLSETKAGKLNLNLHAMPSTLISLTAKSVELTHLESDLSDFEIGKSSDVNKFEQVDMVTAVYEAKNVELKFMNGGKHRTEKWPSLVIAYVNKPVNVKNNVINPMVQRGDGILTKTITTGVRSTVSATFQAAIATTRVTEHLGVKAVYLAGDASGLLYNFAQTKEFAFVSLFMQMLYILFTYGPESMIQYWLVVVPTLPFIHRLCLSGSLSSYYFAHSSIFLSFMVFGATPTLLLGVLAPTIAFLQNLNIPSRISAMTRAAINNPRN